MDIILFAVPFFLLLISIELMVCKKLNLPYYRLNDAVGSLSCGVMEQITHVLLFLGFTVVYTTVQEKWGLLTWGGNVWNWVFAFILVDLAYYIFHRASHTVNIIWGAHVVHHSSEEYNLTTALRQGPLQVMFSFWFYLWLAALGIPFEMFATCFAINLLYQFWIHTRLIRKFPWIVELILNTPSHHRVHHGRNPKYLDKNYAGVFIIWDRLFGSFLEEEDEPVFGITKPLNSFDPVTATVSHYGYLFDVSKRTQKFSDKVRIWFSHPAWKPEDLGGVQPVPFVSRPDQFVLFNPQGSISSVKAMALFFVALLLGIVVMILGPKGNVLAWPLGVAGIFILSIVGRRLSK